MSYAWYGTTRSATRTANHSSRRWTVRSGPNRAFLAFSHQRSARNKGLTADSLEPDTTGRDEGLRAAPVRRRYNAISWSVEEDLADERQDRGQDRGGAHPPYLRHRPQFGRRIRARSLRDRSRRCHGPG